MRTVVAAGLLLVVAACGAQHRAAARTTEVVRHGRPPGWLLARARSAARELEDPDPEKIELFARRGRYEIRVWGRFRCTSCSTPRDGIVITGEVATFVYDGASRTLTSFSLAPRRVVVAADETAPVVREWRHELARGAREEPARRFASPPLAVLRRRLALAARRYGFSVERVELRQPRQLAPQITIQGPHRVAHALGPIIDLVDPPPRSNARAYEGILVEAVDPQGVPFAIAWDSLRGQVAGGQWAAAPDLYPFAHG
jgi:hypothetical protein